MFKNFKKIKKNNSVTHLLMTGMILIAPSMEHWKGSKIMKSNASLKMRTAYKELNVLRIFIQPALMVIYTQREQLKKVTTFFHCFSILVKLIFY